jgi:archaellum component FlaC
MSVECDNCNEDGLVCECENEKDLFERVCEIESTLNRLTFVIEEIREQVSEKSYRSKVERTNTLIRNLQDLDEKVNDNMNRLNQMLLKLKANVAVALGNLAQ